ncbi:MAG: hypothetical protein HYZ91_02490 [Candidatus Omnitrophica bacterium]|nr:hypothetical protein [Candidatus Omnitrophota bacterium]
MWHSGWKGVTVSERVGFAAALIAARSVFSCLLPPAACLLLRAPVSEAAVSEGKNQRLESAETNQGGGTVSSSTFRQQIAFGGATAGSRVISSRFRLDAGFIAASLSATTPAPPSELELKVLYAKTELFGPQITPQTWQKDHDPVFMWEPPQTGPEVAGYSYAIDGMPDAVVETTTTSYDMAAQGAAPLADGKHTFSVSAVNGAGSAGPPISIEVWVDATPPQIGTYGPEPGSLMKVAAPAVTATISDAASGVQPTGMTLLINGNPASFTVDQTTGILTATRGAWKEGTNSLELRVTDLAGNAQVPLVWSITIDTMPPTGTVTVNGGASMTTSIYVTLGLNASDATSGVARMLVSNDLLTGYVEEPYVAQRELWQLTALRGLRTVYVKFIDKAGNVSEAVSDEIDLGLLSPETIITSGPAGFSLDSSGSFTFRCPEGSCVFSFAFDNDAWSAWSSVSSATTSGLVFGNHYFRVKAARDVNGSPGIQLDEEDPSPAERTWIVGVEPPMLTAPKGPPIKVWRLE